MTVVKNNGMSERYDILKLAHSIRLSFRDAIVEFDEEDINHMTTKINSHLETIGDTISSDYIAGCVLEVLYSIDPSVAKVYQDYRNYKYKFVKAMDSVYKQSHKILTDGSKENSNSDSALVATKKNLVASSFDKERYKMFFLKKEEQEALEAGFIYVHDMSARLYTYNCCIFDAATVLKGGFTMGNLQYTECKSLPAVFDVLGDVILNTASQQYGGFTVPEIEKVLEPYAEKSYEQHKKDYLTIAGNNETVKAEKYALEKVTKEIEQGYQGWEMKFNSVGSSRGDYPFIAMTLGLAESELGRLISKTIFRTHARGQGEEGKRRPTLFPKLIMLYDEGLHNPSGPCYDVYTEALLCSSKSMYPDWLSLTGEGYVPSIYKEYGKVISPMGCRAFLSPWYERGGMYPADASDEPVFVGRFNIGVVSLHLPLIYAESERLNKDFFELLDYYLEMIRGIHLRTYEYLAQFTASINPVCFCEGGFYRGHLQPGDSIAPCLETATASFGITALNELQQLRNQKSLVEDGQFALDVMNYIVYKVEKFKKEDGRLYAIYGTPGESLCGTQVKQFRYRFGRVPGVSDREYVSNSFHCHVSEDITPIQKQDLEYRFWDLFNGGKIQYVKYPINYNLKAIDTLVRRAMDLGYYEGVNLALSYCSNCGHEQLNMNCCPVCGSEDITKIERMNGYLSYSRVQGHSRLNAAKMAEIADRRSM